jgi:hypothetical protein
MSIMKDCCIDAEEGIRTEIAQALSDIGFTDDDAENIADSIDIPWTLLLDQTTDRYTTLIDFAHDSLREP